MHNVCNNIECALREALDRSEVEKSSISQGTLSPFATQSVCAAITLHSFGDTSTTLDQLLKEQRV